MNLKFINRKQALGIIHPADYSNWAAVVESNLRENSHITPRYMVPVNNNIKWLSHCNYVIGDDFRSSDMQEHIRAFNAALEHLNLDFEHSALDNSPYVQTIQSILADACEQRIAFHMIDLRPISELGTDLASIELVDKMMVECGCNPIGDYWIEYSPEDGRKALQAVFQAQVVPDYQEINGPIKDSALAKQFLAHFDESVRFYGNSCYAPWEEGYKSKPPVQSKVVQSRFETDFALVLCDNKTIGFLMVASDLY